MSATMAGAGEVLWTPPPDARDRTRIGEYLRWLERTRGLRFDSYETLWTWSVGDLEAFWGSIWDFFEIRSNVPHERVLASADMPGAVWFPGARLNYAENLLDRGDELGSVVIHALSDSRPTFDVTLGELRDQVARARAGLERLGVRSGDRVAAYLPNVPEAVVAFLATASLGAVWASCAPEFGPRAVVDRFGQIDPKVMLTVTGYDYGDRPIDRGADVQAIAERLPGLERIVHVPYGRHDSPPAGAVTWDELLAEPAAPAFEAVPFDHPLFVLFSSGTTGLPKAIVHGHGGILLEHSKLLALLWDLGPGDSFFLPTTTAWMMWNAVVSVLATGARVTTFDGDLMRHPGRLFELAAASGATVTGATPAAITLWRKVGLEPAREYDLAAVRELVTAGSPLPAESYRWVYEQFPANVLLSNGSGGTDVCSGFTSSTFLTPVWAGEMSARCLGVAAYAFDEGGNEIVGELGELVITKPMPSMPVFLWNDPDGRRYRETYFDRYPGVWRQGDWVVFTERGSAIVTGRSDATLNRGGVRLGSGDFYAVLEELPEVTEGLVVHLEATDGGMGELLLFVVLAPGVDLDGVLQGRIASALRENLSPRHLPDAIVAAPAVPKTLTGKKLELPVKRILQGMPLERVASRDGVSDPDALAWFAAFAARRDQGRSV